VGSPENLIDGEQGRVAESSEIVTAHATAVRTLGRLSVPHQKRWNATGSALCRASQQSVQGKVVYQTWNSVKGGVGRPRKGLLLG
jgi:hypothetical protein